MKKSKITVIILLIMNSLSVLNCSSQIIAGGTSHSLSICADSTVMAWGDNYYGELGNGSNTNSNVPVHVSFLTGIKSISAGMYHSLALKNDGTVWAWGGGGLLGNGTTTGSNVPVQVSFLSGVIAIAAGGNFSLALKNDGTVWSWGSNASGQLGNGTNTASNVPVEVSSLTGVTSIAASTGWSGTHALALKNDSTVWSWGGNYDGELGNGSNIDSNVPVQVSALNGVIAIGAGQQHSIALKSDGRVWTWGRNVFGQLGDGTFTDTNVPVLVSSLTGIIAIGAGGSDYSIALKNDGTVWTWGANYNSELGNGTSTNSNVPVQVSSLTGVTVIARGDSLCLAMKSDGTVWAWGGNWSGQLGDGTHIQRNIPVQVIGLCATISTSNCIANYTTSYDSTLNNFTLTVDSTTTDSAVAYHWDFGDGATSSLATPSHIYTVDSLYNVCMQIFTASGDSCTYCSIIGKDSAGNIIRAGGFTLNVQNSNTVTGISNHFSNDAQFEVFPNPTNGIFSLRSVKNSVSNVEIYNVLGVCIYKKAGSFQDLKIDLTDQPSGIYFLNLISEQRIVSEKIVVNK